MQIRSLTWIVFFVILVHLIPTYGEVPEWSKIKSVLDAAKGNSEKKTNIQQSNSQKSEATLENDVKKNVPKDGLSDFDAFDSPKSPVVKNQNTTTVYESPTLNDATTFIDDKEFYPKDERFWKFKKDLEQRCILSVIVDGRDPQHLQSIISQWQNVCQKKGTIPGDFIVLKPLDVPNKSGDLSSQITAPSIPFTQDPDLDNEFIKKIVDTYQPKYSPVWIIRSNGSDYVFQGNYNIEKFFE